MATSPRSVAGCATAFTATGGGFPRPRSSRGQAAPSSPSSRSSSISAAAWRSPPRHRALFSRSHMNPQFAGMLARAMAVGPRRNGVFGGWTRAGNSRVFVRVPSRLKQRSAELNGFGANGDRPELEGTPVVLVHGLSSSRSLRPLIKALGGRHPVFAPDLPGFGMTDQPIHPLDIRGLANALRRWMVEN